ncbi:MAG: F420-dependent NADP oxidoreductase [Cytophagales bacterium]|nr:F420-dependent NADP oxidoreductase [Cytophagales bacterium]
MKYRVSIIGAGNLAWHLAPTLDNAGFGVAEVYSRSVKKAKSLVERLYQAESKKNLDFSNSNSDVFIIAVNDDAIEEVAQEIVLPAEDSILVHTSGSRSMGILSYAAVENIGIFYPLQTFNKEAKVQFDEIPICVEASTAYAEGILAEIGNSLSKKVVSIDSDQRRALHVAAVFANNFVNHCLRISYDIMKSEKLDGELIRPLVEETIRKAFQIGPERAQTGPAKRHDYETLDEHLDYLKENDELAEVYRIFSQYIVDCYPLED